MSKPSRLLWTVLPPVVRGVGRLFFSLRVEQETDLPDPPFVIAANHYSHFDSPVVGAVLGVPVRFLALEDLFETNRLVERMVEIFGAIRTPRHRTPVGAVRQALGALDSGDVVGLFPEATRVSHWGTLTPKRGAAWLAIAAGVPLVPVAVIGTGQVFGLENRLRSGSIRVVIGEPLEAGDDPGKLIARWAEWMTTQISQHPGTEVAGPRRAHHSGS